MAEKLTADDQQVYEAADACVDRLESVSGEVSHAPGSKDATVFLALEYGARGMGGVWIRSRSSGCDASWRAVVLSALSWLRIEASYHRSAQIEVTL